MNIRRQTSSEASKNEDLKKYNEGKAEASQQNVLIWTKSSASKHSANNCCKSGNPAARTNVDANIQQDYA